MKLVKPVSLAAVAAVTFATASAQVPDNLVADGVLPHPAELKASVSRYLEFRTAAFQSWHPQRREMLIATRFADSTQVHLVRQPGGARRQLTFFAEPVAGASFRPKNGDCFVYSQDTGGGEFFQLFRYDLADGRTALLTDGKSRNTAGVWSKSGGRIVWSSTHRNGRDTDLWVMDPFKPAEAKMLLERKGGGWAVSDWSEDESKLVVGEYVSITESRLHLYDFAKGEIEPLLPGATGKAAYSDARFSKDGRAVLCTTDEGSEFHQLIRIDLVTKKRTVLTKDLKWNVDGFEISPDGRTIAYVSNEDGVSTLHLIEAQTGRAKLTPKLPLGVIGGLEWHPQGNELGFSLAHARSPSDAYSLDVKKGTVTRWTESETGGLDARHFVEPRLVRTKSFDGLGISAFVYAPDAKKFPGRRPVIINIHGGPEAQARPIFQGRNNYFLDELGVAIVFPNVRGSDGYGKSFLTLDDGAKREDSVKDIGAIIEWVKQQPEFDPARIAVTGGSYGGYMTLASMTHFNDQLRCAVDVVGISNFVTFLENTQDYRRDLRRVEYGDERDPAMREVLQRISPTTNVRQITKPLFVVQGKNDPRVPVTEAEQMVKAVRNNGGVCWYLMAKDEGHGFQKKRNADFQFLSTILFYQEHLLK
jgi:dipeptidyl aminopeptidase/acylaminoacyl peptidase